MNDEKTNDKSSAPSGMVQPVVVLTGVEAIARERDHQLRKGGWSKERDFEEHHRGELAIAGACYAINGCDDVDLGTPLRVLGLGGVDGWPWGDEWDKRAKHPRLRQLAIAGALIAAEIDRLSAMHNATVTGPNGSEKRNDEN